MVLEQKARQKAEQQYNWKVTVNQIEQAYQIAVSHRRSGQLKRLYYLLLLGAVTFVFFSYGFYLKIMGKTEPERVWEPGRE